MSVEAVSPPLLKIDKQQFRKVCSTFATGITVATVLDPAGKSHGMTANSFTSVSLVPPLLLVCVDHRSKLLECFRQNGHFGINILHQSQRQLSDRFAGSGYDRFEGVDWYPGQTGVPLLPDALATIECKRVQLVTAGDHDIVIGEVVHATCREGEPLLYFGSKYRQLQ
jgi:flavin reductase (DIM6/NTAB) family NADH-FMN oxidoreductase RutF